jgi:glyoxylase-like metal-dependent hydrolase (beta-lactamase superfamily II)
MPLPDYLADLGGGVYAIDTGFQRPRFDAAYLLVQDGCAAFIDNGTNHTLPRHLGALDALGIAREAVDYVIPTHVHLDHAGCSGVLMRELPNAALFVHPRGAKHLIDPSALIESALAVYGPEEMARSYGDIVGVDEARVRTTHDGMDLLLGGTRRLHFIDTPGHARHHHCLWDESTRGWFTGDTFGISYREFDVPGRGAWIKPTHPPTQFEPDAMRESIARMIAFDPACLYLTHYSRVADVRRLARHLLKLLDAVVEIGHKYRDAPDRHEVFKRELSALYTTSLHEHGVDPALKPAEILWMDIELNAQGLGHWLDREARQQSKGKAA